MWRGSESRSVRPGVSAACWRIRRMQSVSCSPCCRPSCFWQSETPAEGTRFKALHHVLVGRERWHCAGPQFSQFSLSRPKPLPSVLSLCSHDSNFHFLPFFLSHVTTMSHMVVACSPHCAVQPGTRTFQIKVSASYFIFNHNLLIPTKCNKGLESHVIF